MAKEITIIKAASHESFTVHLRSDGIVHVHILASTRITVELQKFMEDSYKEVTSIKRPFIFSGDEFVSITKEARTNAIVMANRIPIICSAIVVRNLAQKIIADYYYKFNKPPDPYKVFKSFDDGIDWLRSNFNPEVISN